MTASPRGLEVGDSVVVDVGPVAHGGHCVARHEGRVLFVRHTLPGERVVARITGIGAGGRFLRADAVEVHTASPDRREAPCPVAGPGGCGGCDWQHVDPQAQRRLKADVVSEQLRRLGGVEREVVVEAVPGDVDGLRWRTRVGFGADAEGRLGLRRHHGHDVVPVERCLLATDEVDAVGATRTTWPAGSSVSVVASSLGDTALRLDPPPATRRAKDRLLAAVPEGTAVLGVRGSARVRERVEQRELLVAADGFWQVHPGAPHALVSAVRDGLEPRPGDHLLDLYAGAGLFAVALADELGPGGRVDAVEHDPAGASAARRNVHDLPTVHVHEGRVDRWLTQAGPKRCDLVVLDPPEAGAGEKVLARVVRLSPRRLVYVACDPAALGRDVAVLAGLGWSLQGLRALDLFPTTHHVECVATFAPA